MFYALNVAHEIQDAASLDASMHKIAFRAHIPIPGFDVKYLIDVK